MRQQRVNGPAVPALAAYPSRRHIQNMWLGLPFSSTYVRTELPLQGGVSTQNEASQTCKRGSHPVASRRKRAPQGSVVLSNSAV